MVKARIGRRDKVFLITAFAAVVFFSSVSIAVNALAPDVPTSSNYTAMDPRVQDSNFILRLGSPTLVGRSQAQAIALGRTACDALETGGTGATLMPDLLSRGLDSQQAAKVVYAAVEAYCPGYRMQAQR